MMELVSTVTVGSGGAASVEFTDIPQTGKDLRVVLSFRSETTVNTATLSLNGSSSSFTRIWFTGDGSNAQSGSATNSTLGFIQTRSDYSASTFSATELYITNYTATANKNASTFASSTNTATPSGIEFNAIRQAVSAAVTSLRFTGVSGDIAQHSTASLYIIS